MEKMYSRKKAIGAGAIGGIVAGIVMLAPMMGMMSMMNLPHDLFPKLIGLSIGQTMESASSFGTVLHFLPSIVVGVIFGAVVSSSRLSITSFKKGIPLGIAAGIISFIVLFLPFMMTVLPPIMMQLMQMMNPEAPQEMVMTQLQGMQPMMLAGALISHIIYGAVLGLVSTAIIRKSN